MDKILNKNTFKKLNTNSIPISKKWKYIIFTLVYFILSIIFHSKIIFLIIYLFFILFIIILEVFKFEKSDNLNKEAAIINNINFNEFYLNSINNKFIDKKIFKINNNLKGLEKSKKNISKSELMDKFNTEKFKIITLKKLILKNFNPEKSNDNNLNFFQNYSIFSKLKKLWLLENIIKKCMEKVPINQLNSNRIKKILNIKKLDHCSLCLLNEEEFEVYNLLGCNHYFHLKCYKNWSEMKNECPKCKY